MDANGREFLGKRVETPRRQERQGKRDFGVFGGIETRRRGGRGGFSRRDFGFLDGSKRGGAEDAEVFRGGRGRMRKAGSGGTSFSCFPAFLIESEEGRDFR